MTYEDIVRDLDNAPWFGRTPELTRMDALLDALELPQAGMKNIIVTGTDGKGSVCSYLHSVLKRTYKVGRFISPHLEDWTERIRVNDEDISKDDFARLYSTVMDAAKVANRICGEMPTVFERLLALAILYFQEQQTDWNVIEVGIEGRYDSTNLLPAEAVVVTSVGLDHTRLLGDTIPEIAKTIAYGIRPHKVLVIGNTDDEAMDVLEQQGRQKKAMIYRYGRDYWYDGEFHSYSGSLRFSLQLKGVHQWFNASAAIQTLLALNGTALRVTPSDIQQGLADAFWPGRLETVKTEPLLILDGAHNPHAAKALRTSLDVLYPGKKWTIFFSAMKDKDWRSVLAQFTDISERFFVVKMPYERAEDPSVIVEYLRMLGVSAQEATETDVLKCEDDALVFGSLYLVGDVRRLLKNA
jgi:dihydrofolate synthase/folylpolyglutamate synthase